MTGTEIDWKEQCAAVQRTTRIYISERKRAESDRGKAERACRDITIDRDRWKSRALKAEATLASLGGDA